MTETEHRITRTTTDGTEYTLEYDGLYRWTRQGTVANALKGGYTGPQDALMAFNMYNASLSFVADKMSGEEELEALNTKKELIGYAEAKGIEVPPKYKWPSAIKKFLMGGYND